MDRLAVVAVVKRLLLVMITPFITLQFKNNMDFTQAESQKGTTLCQWVCKTGVACVIHIQNPMLYLSKNVYCCNFASSLVKFFLVFLLLQFLIDQ